MYRTQYPVLPEPELPRRSFKPLTWWLHLTSSGWQHPPANFNDSERARRSRLASLLFLGLLIAGLAFLTAGASDLPTLLAIIAAMVGVIIACALNRAGAVEAAGLIVPMVVLLAVLGADLSAPGGLLGPDYLPSYDILVLGVVVAGSLLPPIAAFFMALINSVAILVDFLVLQSPNTVLTQEIKSDGLGLLLGRPIGLEIAVAVVAYLWVTGTVNAARRADRAEEIATLEHAYAQQRQQLEIGVQQILATHVRIANGDYSARAPLSQDHALWQIASSLNNLVSRFRTFAEQTNRVGYQLQRTEEEIHRLAVALRDLQAGRRPIWPAPSRTAVDELLPILAGRDRRQPTLPAGQGWESGTGPIGPLGQGGPSLLGEFSQGRPSGGGTGAPLTPPPGPPSGWAHMPPRFGPPLTNDTSWQQRPGMGQDESRPRTGPISEPMSRMPPIGRMPSMPSMPPAGPQPEMVTPRSFEENWPSLDSSSFDPSNLVGSRWGAGEAASSNGNASRDDSSFPSLDDVNEQDDQERSDNPWYLPPDE